MTPLTFSGWIFVAFAMGLTIETVGLIAAGRLKSDQAFVAAFAIAYALWLVSP